MKPIIHQQSQQVLLGYSFFGDPFQSHSGWHEENEIGRLWKRYMQFMGTHGKSLQDIITGNVAYEIHIETLETQQTGEFEVFVGMEVSKMDQVPLELSFKVLPASTYAVFTLSGTQIHADWNELIFEGWLAASEYETAFPYVIQAYDERFKGVDHIAESEIDVWIPIKKKTVLK